MPSLKDFVNHFFRRLPAPLHRLPAEWRQTELRETVRRRFTESGAKWTPETKVFGIGLSKTGTTSLSQALNVLGYKSLTWKWNGKILDWPEFYYADAATDTPCSAQFESLYHTFEKSKFVYTVRDLESWERSIENYLGQLIGVEHPRDFRELHCQPSFWEETYGWAFQSSIRWIQIHESLYAQHDSWKEAYRAFDHRVRRFFEDKPDDRFLEMNITEGDGWETLCPFLGCDVPDRSFPHGNPSKGAQKGS